LDRDDVPGGVRAVRGACIVCIAVVGGCGSVAEASVGAAASADHGRTRRTVVLTPPPPPPPLQRSAPVTVLYPSGC